MANVVSFYDVPKQTDFDAASKDANGVYFVEDTARIYKGDKKFGADETPIATSTTVGTVKPGGDFDIATDGTLTLYTKIVLSLPQGSIGNNVGNVEIGSKVTAAKITWNYNKIPTAQTVKVGTGAAQTVAADAKSTDLTFDPALTANTTITVTGTDARNASSSVNTTIKFLNKKYYGVGTVTSADDVTNEFVLGLANGTLVENKNGNFKANAAAGQFIYFAIPASFGTPAFFVGGFEGGFDLLKTFNFTNASGYTTSYNVYKSTNAGLGDTTVTVK